MGTLNIRCRIIIRTQKGTIILTTTHVFALSFFPCPTVPSGRKKLRSRHKVLVHVAAAASRAQKLLFVLELSWASVLRYHPRKATNAVPTGARHILRPSTLRSGSPSNPNQDQPYLKLS